MRGGVATRERVHADELRHHLRGKEKRENADVRPDGAERHVHPTLEEEERSQEGKCDDAQSLLLLPMFDVVVREREPEDECGQNGMRVRPVAEPHQEEE